MTTIFVRTGLDLKARNNIIKEIQKKLPDLKIANSVEGADIFLVFGQDAATYVSGVTTMPIPGTDINRSRPQYSEVIYATGYVAKITDRMRILMSFEDTRSTIFERKPETNFARAFIKAYLQAQKKQTELEKNPYYRMATGTERKPAQ